MGNIFCHLPALNIQFPTSQLIWMHKYCIGMFHFVQFMIRFASMHYKEQGKTNPIQCKWQDSFSFINTSVSPDFFSHSFVRDLKPRLFCWATPGLWWPKMTWQTLNLIDISPACADKRIRVSQKIKFKSSRDTALGEHHEINSSNLSWITFLFFSDLEIFNVLPELKFQIYLVIFLIFSDI